MNYINHQDDDRCSAPRCRGVAQTVYLSGATTENPGKRIALCDKHDAMLWKTLRREGPTRDIDTEATA